MRTLASLAPRTLGIIGACVVLVAAGFVVSARAQTATCPVTVGKPYRTAEVSTVFVITEGCEKRPVFNPDVYFSHFASFSEVKFVKASVLASVPNSALQFLPWGPRRVFGNGSLLKTVTDPKVYLLIDGNLYAIASEQAFAALGFTFSQVEDVVPEVLAKFVNQGISLTGADNVPAGLVFKYQGDAKVYVLQTEGGVLVKSHIGDMDTLKRLVRLDRIAVLPLSRTFPDAVTDPHAGHGPAGGPHIDISAIPEGHPGTDELRIIPAPFPRRVADGVGAFRTQCQMTHMNFDDPLVFPGQVGASHLHAFFGNALIDASLQAGHLRDAGTKSTCGGGIANLSGYWVPALIDENGVPLVPTNNIVYYKSGYGGVDPEDVTEFPAGLRMIAGNAKSSSSQAPMAYWECIEVSNEHFPSIPSRCPQGSKELQMSIQFPQCWDGVNLDSADHKSHMAYPNNGCPSSHPIPIPAISYNIRYKLPADGDISKWRLASDMYSTDLPGGFSAHGDWWDGWDHAIVKKWMANCVNAGMDCGGGLISDTEYLKEF